jgi:hypothetical protein
MTNPLDSVRSKYLLLVAAILIAIWFVIDPLIHDWEKHSWHFFLELFVGVLMLYFTIEIVERILRAQRRRENEEHWEVIRCMMLISLATTVKHMMRTSPLLSGLPERPEDKRWPTRAAVQEYSDIVRCTISARLPNGDWPRPLFDEWGLLSWFDKNALALDYLRPTIIPRFLEFNPRHAVMHELILLEQRILGLNDIERFRTNRQLAHLHEEIQAARQRPPEPNPQDEQTRRREEERLEIRRRHFIGTLANTVSLALIRALAVYRILADESDICPTCADYLRNPGLGELDEIANPASVFPAS